MVSVPLTEKDYQRRAVIAALAAAVPPVTLKEASRAIGRNDAYLQQFIHRLSPRKLPEDVRHQLANYLGIDQQQLVGTPTDDTRAVSSIHGASPHAAHVCAVPFLHSPDDKAVEGTANGGTSFTADRWIFPQQWVKRLGCHDLTALRLISISGDSMAPRLEADDIVMLDRSQAQPSPPGLFIINDGIGLIAKQIELIPNTLPPMLQVKSENPAYKSYQRRIDEVKIIGRVVWFARRV